MINLFNHFPICTLAYFREEEKSHLAKMDNQGPGKDHIWKKPRDTVPLRNRQTLPTVTFHDNTGTN